MRQTNILQLTRLDDLVEMNRVLKDIQQRLNDAMGGTGEVVLDGNTVVRGEMRLQELPQQQQVPTDEIQGKVFFQPRISQAPEAQVQVTEDTIIDSTTNQKVHRLLDVVQRAQHDGVDLGKASSFNFGVGLDATLDIDNDVIDVVATHEDVVHADNAEILYWNKPGAAPGEFYGDPGWIFVHTPGNGPEVILQSDIANYPIFHIISTDTGPTSGFLKFEHLSSSPAANDNLGVIHFNGNDSNLTEKTFVTLLGRTFDPTVAAPIGIFAVDILNGAGNTTHLYFQGALCDAPHLITDAYAGELASPPDQDDDLFLLYDLSATSNKKIRPKYLSGNLKYMAMYSGSPNTNNRNNSTGETELASYGANFAAGELITGDWVDIWLVVSLANNANTKTIKTYIGTGAAVTLWTGTTGNVIMDLHYRVLFRGNTGAAIEGQTWYAANGAVYAGTMINGSTTPSDISANSQYFKLTVQGGATQDILVTDMSYVVYRAGGNAVVVT